MKKGYVFTLITFFFWGSLYVVNRYALASVPPCTLLFSRQFLAVFLVGFLAVHKGMKPIERRHWPHFLGIGICGYFLATNMMTLTTTVMDASAAALFGSLSPVMISFLAVIFLKEKIRINQVLGLACSLLGVFVVLGADMNGVRLLGICFSVGSMVFWGINSILIRKISGLYESEQITFVGLLVGLPFCLIASVAEMQSKPPVFAWEAVLAIVYLGVFCTALTNLTWSYSLKLLDASVCSLFYPFQTLFASILGILFLKESLSAGFVMGAILISVGVFIGVFRTKKK